MTACFNRASVERDLGKGHLKALQMRSPQCLLFAPACLREVYRKETIKFKLVVSCECGVTPLQPPVLHARALNLACTCPA
jgi:hypothetical protein